MSHEQTRSTPAKPTLKSRAIAGGIVGIAAIAIAVFVFQSGKKNGGDATTEAGAAEPGESTEVHLNAEKLRFAEIELAKSVRQPIRETRVVPGKLTYDAARYLEITAGSTLNV